MPLNSSYSADPSYLHYSWPVGEMDEAEKNKKRKCYLALEHIKYRINEQSFNSETFKKLHLVTKNLPKFDEDPFLDHRPKSAEIKVRPVFVGLQGQRKWGINATSNCPLLANQNLTIEPDKHFRDRTKRNEVITFCRSKCAKFCECPGLPRICVFLYYDKRRVNLVRSGRRECVLWYGHLNTGSPKSNWWSYS